MSNLTDEEKEFIERVRPLLREFLEFCKQEGYDPGAGSYVLSERNAIYHGVPFSTIRSIHGEENAIGTMVTEEGWKSKFRMILVVGAPDRIITPCGLCREAILRYGVENATVLCSTQSLSKIEKYNASELYPHRHPA